jgi:replicative DNA helicase
MTASTIDGIAVNFEAEEALLGAVLLTEDALAKAALIVTPDDFYRPLHQQLWATYLRMRAADIPIDPVSVYEQLAADQHFQRAGGAVWLHNLSRACPTATNIIYYAGVVTDKASRRRLSEAGQRIWQLATTDDTELDEILSLARHQVAAAAPRTYAGNANPVAGLVDEYVLGLDYEPTGVVQTPWPDLDDVFNGGLRPGEVVIVAARPSAGKSVVGLNVARAAAQHDIPTLLFSLEMPREEVLARLVADTGTIPLSNLIRHELDLEDRARLARTIERIRDWPLWIDDRTDLSTDEIEAAATERLRDGLGLVVVDYSGLIRAADPKASRQEQVARISRDLVKIARKLNVPMLVLHQLNRGPELRAKGRPTMADLRESGQVEADANKIILLWRQDDRPGELCMIIAKNRNGKTPDIVLTFSGHYARVRSDHLPHTVS